jgi:uncharacterized membrane protein
MNFLRQFARGTLHLGRIEAFSDGVFAIIVTLLVLDLKVPALKDPGSVTELARDLVSLLPQFLSWLISFVIVCKFWLNHHHIIGLARHADYGMVWLNSIFLMGQAFIPFPTALLGTYATNPLAVSFFGAIFALNTLLFILLRIYILRRLAQPARAAREETDTLLKYAIGPVSYLVGAALAWVSIYAAFLVYMITPFFYITPHVKEVKAAKAAKTKAAKRAP